MNKNQCSRPCKYRGASFGDEVTAGCDYLLLTGCSRLKAAMEMLGVDRLTPEVKELLEPENCQLFEEGPRTRRRSRPVTWGMEILDDIRKREREHGDQKLHHSC